MRFIVTTRDTDSHMLVGADLGGVGHVTAASRPNFGTVVVATLNNAALVAAAIVEINDMSITAAVDLGNRTGMGVAGTAAGDDCSHRSSQDEKLRVEHVERKRLSATLLMLA
jgi:hypothetical protein